MAANVITAMEANFVIHLATGVSQEYRQLITKYERFTWKISLDNELEQLAQCSRTIKGTNTVLFIPKHEVPFTTKKSHMEKLCLTSNQIKLKHIAPG